MDVNAWLDELGLGQYSKAFAENDIDWDVLAELTESDLEAIGVSLGHRKKILRSIRSFAPTTHLSDLPAGPAYGSPSDYIPGHLADRIRATRDIMKGERKHVTILFADIKGSLELIQGSDPERAHDLLDVVIRILMEAVHRYEGTVNKVLGDGIMAIFGAPIGLEDHAVRACYAALAMIDAVAGKADAIRRDHGVEIQVRVGLHSGEVIVRGIGNDLAMDYDAIGPTTHLAGRMEQLALPGTVRLSADTARLAEGFIETRSLGPVPVKGIGQAIELFELTGAAEAPSRFHASLARGLSRFVGREAELAALGSSLDRVKQGQGQIFATIGEPGLGKSRLYHEFVRTAGLEGWLVLSGGAVSYGKATPYLPVIGLLKSYFKIELRDTPRDIREKVTGKLLTLDEGLRPLLAPMLNLLDVPVEDPDWSQLEPAQRRRQTIAAIKSLLLRESREQPVVVILEDLHWIDGETQVVLDVFVEALPLASILLLVNYRPEYLHGWGALACYAQRRLEPLPKERAEALLTTLLGDNPELAPLKRRLIDRTEGNPFFVEESVRSLVEAGDLIGIAGAYRPSCSVDSLEIPASVQGVLTARIDRLSAEDKRLLQSAAVVGKDVPFTLLQAIVELQEDRLNAGLSALQRAEFLYEARIFPEREFTFQHALTHEVAYGGLLTDTRRALHRTLAEAMERLYANRLAEHWERLAHHCTEAGLVDKAVSYWLRAGERAVERSAYREAIAHLYKGLKLCSALPAGRARDERELRILITLGVPLQAAHGPGSIEVGEIYTRARELCRALGDSPDYFTVLWGLWRFFRKGTDFEQARRLLDEMFALAETRQDPVLLLEAHHAAWSTRFFTGEFSATISHADSGLALFDTQRHAGLTFRFGGHDLRVCGMSMHAQAQWMLGFPDKALRKVEEALALARDLDHPSTLALAIDNGAQVNHMRGEFQVVRERSEALIELAKEHSFHDYLASGRLLRRWALLALGRSGKRPDQWAAHRANRSVAEQEIDEPFFQAIVAEALRRQGILDEALEVVRETLTRSAQLGTAYWDADLLRLKGEMLLVRDAEGFEAAERCFDEALSASRQQGARSLELRAATSLARLWRKQGKTVEARNLLAPIYGWFSEGFDTANLKEAKALLGELM